MKFGNIYFIVLEILSINFIINYKNILDKVKNDFSGTKINEMV